MNYRERISVAKGKASLLQNQLDTVKFVTEAKKADLISLEKAQAFIQLVAKKTQEQLRYHVEDVVNLALETLFPNEYTFTLEFNIKYGKTVAELVFTKEGYPIDILKAAGGGVVDIASLALRIAVWSLSRTDNVLILDEPVARIQPATLQAIAWEVIKELSYRLKLQFIIISNSSNNGEAIHLVADKEFIVKKRKEMVNESEWLVSRVEEIE